MIKRGFLPLRETILNFITLLNHEANNNDNDINVLSRFLDELSLIYHYTSDVNIETFENPQRLNYENVRILVVKHFPNLGTYNIPQEIIHELGQTQIIIGDAIDDITDIVCDLSEVIWCLDNTDENDAVWHFRFGYKHHWGRHLRELQLYLYSLQHGK